MKNAKTDYLTTGDLARHAGCPLAKVTYILERHRIVEDMRAGAFRLFKRERLEEILKFVNAVGHKGIDDE